VPIQVDHALGHGHVDVGSVSGKCDASLTQHEGVDDRMARVERVDAPVGQEHTHRTDHGIMPRWAMDANGLTQAP
jgi:hypothetical protein